MAFCRNCGTQLDDQAAFCQYCGTAQQPAQPQYNAQAQNSYVPPQNAVPVPAHAQNTYTPPRNPAPAADDEGGFLWGALGCCVPIVGLILFLAWQDTKPKTAKAAGKGALISVIAGAVLTVLYVVIMVVIGVVVGAASYY